MSAETLKRACEGSERKRASCSSRRPPDRACARLPSCAQPERERSDMATLLSLVASLLSLLSREQPHPFHFFILFFSSPLNPTNAFYIPSCMMYKLTAVSAASEPPTRRFCFIHTAESNATTSHTLLSVPLASFPTYHSQPSFPRPLRTGLGAGASFLHFLGPLGVRLR